MLTKIKSLVLLFLLFGLFSATIAEDEKDKSKDKRFDKVTDNDDYNFIAANQVFMWLSNNGDGSHDPTTDGSGLYWPGGVTAEKTAIFQDGLVWGGKIDGEIRVGGSTYRHGLQAGKILESGEADNPELDKYRIYRIRKDFNTMDETIDYNSNGVPDREEIITDWVNWPVEDGAPWVDVDNDGVYNPDPDNPFEADHPRIFGDEMLWFVSNDLDASRTNRLHGCPPMGLEMQTTVFAFNRVGDLGNIVFKKYLLINKGNNVISDMYLAQWSDPDLGDANDDMAGCDTTLSLGYVYNGSNNDGIYGANPPAAGYDFFQGPIVESSNPNDSAKFKNEWRYGYKNLPMTAYTFYINPNATYADPELGTYAGAIEMYNYLTSKTGDGNDFIDPNTSEPVDYVLAGDPVEGTGWYMGDGWPGGPGADDIRILMASGPFTMEPGDTQEVVVGIVLAQGSDNINSVKALRTADRTAQFAYDRNFQLPPSPPVPRLNGVSGDQEITLWWEDNAVDYDNEFYSFEGYRVWQYRNRNQADPRLLAVYDVENGVGDIFDTVIVNNQQTLSLTIEANDMGLQHSMNITTSVYTNGPLYNGRPYYFAVTPYARLKDPADYGKFGSFVLETPPSVIEVIPGTNAIDDNYQYSPGTEITSQHTEGFGNGDVAIKVIDPDAFTGGSYSTVFDTIEVNGEDQLAYSFIKNGTTKLVENATNFSQPFDQGLVFDGIKFSVRNWGLDSLNSQLNLKNFRVRDVLQVNGPMGQPISDPPNVWWNKDTTENFSSNGKWTIKASTDGDLGSGSFIWQKSEDDEGLGYDYYEIRFTGESEYYTFSKSFGLGVDGDSPKATDASGNPDTVPFEIWDVGRDLESTEDDERLIIKVLDNVQFNPGAYNFENDGVYTRVNNKDWENIFAYSDPDLDPANLPAQSGTSEKNDHRFGGLKFSGPLPEEGTVIRIRTYKPLSANDKFTFIAKEPNRNDIAKAEENKDEISVFPNPYFGSNDLERDKYNRFVRFTNLPNECTIRIYSLSGVFIKKYEKNSTSQYLDWDLNNKDSLPVASGVYIAYIEIPGAGTKTMKIAVIREQQYIDRL